MITDQLLRDRQSALAQAIAPAATAWAPADHLLADLFDITARAHFKDPKPYPRPGDAERAEAQRVDRYRALLAQAERNRAREAT